MLDMDLVDKALDAASAVQRDYEELSYIQFMDDYKSIPRGTVIFNNNVVNGYPPIGRVLSLSSGLATQFEHPVWIEEKVDGYNIRILKIHSHVIAVTRGGYICPFSTDRIDDLLDTSIFSKHPDLILCGEIAGPENPYLYGGPPFIKEDVQLFIFDIGRWNHEDYLPYEEKTQRIREYKLPTVQMFGRFELQNTDPIKELLLKLHSEFREGVVFKEDSLRNKRAKYTTTNTNIIDIKSGAYNMLDLPPEYFMNRILRLVLFLEEQNLEQTNELSQRLGEAFIKDLLIAIQQTHEQHKVTRAFKCRFRNRENAVKLLNNLSHSSGHIQIKLLDLREQDDFWHLQFERMYPKTSGTLSNILSGRLVFD